MNNFDTKKKETKERKHSDPKFGTKTVIDNVYETDIIIL